MNSALINELENGRYYLKIRTTKEPNPEKERTTLLIPGDEYAVLEGNQVRRCLFLAGVDQRWGLQAKVKYLDTNRVGHPEMTSLISPSDVESVLHDLKFKTRWYKTDRVFCLDTRCGWKGERTYKDGVGYAECPKCGSPCDLAWSPDPNDPGEPWDAFFGTRHAG